MKAKICIGPCGKKRKIESFRLRKKKGSSEYYYMGECKKCEREKRLKFYAENKDSELFRSKAWHKKNRGKMNAYSRQWRKDNPERVKKRRAEYYRKNKVEILAKQKSTNKKYIDRIKDNLEDAHIIRMLRQRTALKRSDIESVPGLIDVAREKIRLHRKLKELKK